MDKLKKLENIINVLETDKITHKEFEEIFAMFLKVIEELKRQLENQITDAKSEANTSFKEVTYSLNELELKIKNLINNSEQTSLSQIKELSQRLSSEINRVESSIPSNPDLSYLERMIREVESKIPKLPKELTQEERAKQARDDLETLEKDERLDISAIKGLGKRLLKLSDDIVNRAISILDNRTSFLINKVSNLQTKVDNINITGGSVTVETPTGTIDGSNTSFTVTATPKWIVADGITYFENSGYTISGLTITMVSPPVSYMRAII